MTRGRHASRPTRRLPSVTLTRVENWAPGGGLAQAAVLTIPSQKI
jgi:hypothetical protein